MEPNNIVEALRATTVMDSQKEALSFLEEASKMIGFLPLLSQVAVNEEIEIPVRQAAAIYFKNTIQRCWVVDETEKEEATPVPEQDRIVVKRDIISLVVQAPAPIRVHFCTATQQILRHDYPEKWPEFPSSIVELFHVYDPNSWVAALNVTHRFTKLYEYRRSTEKQPLYDFMATVLPIIFARFQELVNADAPNEQAAILEHFILKIYYCLNQYSMSTNLIDVNAFGQWILLFVKIIKRPIPADIAAMAEDDQGTAYSWKVKKWAMKIIAKMFDKYGAKGQVEEAYNAYAECYVDNFALQIIECVLVILKDYTEKKFVTDRYVYFAMSHLTDALSLAEVWKVVKPHYNDLVFHVIFPALCYTEEDEEEWESEELDFIRMRHDCFDEMHSPSAAAASVLQAGLKRKGVLEHILQFFVNILNDPKSEVRHVDGALHAIANMMEKLSSARKFKKDVEKLVQMHFIPRVTHENRFVRLHACYCLKMSDTVNFHTKKILKDAVDALMGRICDPNELLAIKVEAGIAINYLLEEQHEKAGQYIRPHVRQLLTELFRLLTQTSLDELTNIADTIIETFPEEVIPVAVDVATEIYNLFVKYAKIEENNDEVGEDDKTVTMIGLLATLQTLLDLVDEYPDISKNLEPIVFDIVGIIYSSDAFEFYEDAVSLVESLMTQHISDKAWDFYLLIRSHFDMSGEPQYPTLNEYMGCLHAYLTIDTEKFLSVEQRPLILLEMCEATLTNFELDMDAHLFAAKLLECFILQCRGRVDQFIPNILQVTMNRLTGGHFENASSELVPQLLVVFIAAMHYNFDLFVHSLQGVKPYGLQTVEWLFTEIFSNKDLIEGIHNRKMVLYAICTMLRLPLTDQPPAISSDPKKVGNFCLEMFDGIDKCLKRIAERKKEDMESSDDDSDDEDNPNRTIDDELRDSDDDIDEGTLEYLDQLNRAAKKESRKRDADDMNGNDGGGDDLRSDSDDSEGYHLFNEETEVESYTTPLDDEENGINVYVLFKTSLEALQANHPTQFTQMTAMEGEQADALKKLCDYCVQQENLVKSREVARAGGCVFDASAKVPNSFNFTK